MSVSVPSRGNRYTPAEIDTALTTLILAGGNSEKASEAMNGEPSADSLNKWKHTHADRYEVLQRELAPQIAEKVAAEAEALALKMSGLEDALINRITAKVDELDGDKASAALRNVTTSKALQFDKISSPTRGRPSQIHEHRDGTEILRGLAARIGMTINSTADEISTEPHELEEGSEAR